jgi:hypothetical protein
MRGALGESAPILNGEFLNVEALFDEGDGAVEAVAQKFLLPLGELVLGLLAVVVAALDAPCLVPLCLEGTHAVDRTALPHGLAVLSLETAEDHRSHSDCFAKRVHADVA